MFVLLLKGFFWFALFCLLTGLSVGPAMVIGLLGVLVGGLVSALAGPRKRGGPGCGD